MLPSTLTTEITVKYVIQGKSSVGYIRWTQSLSQEPQWDTIEQARQFNTMDAADSYMKQLGVRGRVIPI